MRTVNRDSEEGSTVQGPGKPDAAVAALDGQRDGQRDRWGTSLKQISAGSATWDFPYEILGSPAENAMQASFQSLIPIS